VEKTRVKMPFEYQHHNAHGCRMAVWRITESEEELIDLTPFTLEMAQQLDQFTCPSRRLEWLASRVLLYQLAGWIPLVEYTKTGQPFVQQSEQNISISHTRGFAAVCISPSLAAGIDIEYPSNRISRIASRFIHPREAEFIPADNPDVYHALIWCAKETVFKMAGISGIIFKEDILVLPFGAKTEGWLEVKLFSENQVKEIHLLYKVTTDYYLVWHCEKD
jgi:4'-phosphopantetheinyl transferase